MRFIYRPVIRSECHPSYPGGEFFLPANCANKREKIIQKGPEHSQYSGLFPVLLTKATGHLAAPAMPRVGNFAYCLSGERRHNRREPVAASVCSRTIRVKFFRPQIPQINAKNKSIFAGSAMLLAIHGEACIREAGVHYGHSGIFG